MKKKILSILTITLVVMCTLMPVVLATTVGPLTIESTEANSEATSKLGELTGKLIGIGQIIGIAVAVIMAMVLGIKYMTGSAEEKAANQKTMVPYVVGALVLFFATTIVNILYNLAK